MTATLADVAPAAATYPTCRRCRRHVRPHHARADDHPGTVAYGGRGLCAYCRRLAGPDTHRRALLEDVDWLTRPGNFTSTPEQVAARVGYKNLRNLIDVLRRHGALDLVQRLRVKAAEG